MKTRSQLKLQAVPVACPEHRRREAPRAEPVEAQIATVQNPNIKTDLNKIWLKVGGCPFLRQAQDKLTSSGTVRLNDIFSRFMIGLQANG